MRTATRACEAGLFVPNAPGEAENVHPWVFTATDTEPSGRVATKGGPESGRLGMESRLSTYSPRDSRESDESVPLSQFFVGSTGMRMPPSQWCLVN